MPYMVVNVDGNNYRIHLGSFMWEVYVADLVNQGDAWYCIRHMRSKIDEQWLAPSVYEIWATSVRQNAEHGDSYYQELEMKLGDLAVEFHKICEVMKEYQHSGTKYQTLDECLPQFDPHVDVRLKEQLRTLFANVSDKTLNATLTAYLRERTSK